MKFPIKSKEVTVNTVNVQALFSQVSTRFDKGTGFAVATLNLDHLVKMRRSPDFLDAYVKQDFIVADGNPIVWLAKLAKTPIELVPGSELVLPLAKLAAEKGIEIALLGSTKEALEQAKSGMKLQIPNLKVAICIAPPFGFDPTSPEAEAMMNELKKTRARLCFLALGAPKQEKFAALGRDLLPEMGFVSIGAGLDFIAGSQTRAPRWVQKLAMEWLWRMMLSPRRLFTRYAACAAILPGLAIQASKQSRHR